MTTQESEKTIKVFKSFHIQNPTGEDIDISWIEDGLAVRMVQGDDAFLMDVATSVVFVATLQEMLSNSETAKLQKVQAMMRNLCEPTKTPKAAE